MPDHPRSRERLIERYGERYRWQIIAVVAVGMMGAILPSSSFVVAIPSILRAFHASQAEGQLIMTSFMVASTIVMLPAPWLLQRFSVRLCFLWVITLLTITSVLGALSPTLGWLIAIRTVQGALAGILLPMSSIVIMRLFEPEQQGRASGILGLTVTLAPAVAPTIGGLLVDHWGWRSVALMPLPFCVVSALAAWSFLPVRDSDTTQRFDGVGMTLLSVLTLSWLGAISSLSARGTGQWWLLFWLLMLSGSIAGFMLHARRHPSPLYDLRVLRTPRVAMGAIVNFAQGFGMYSAAFLVPLYFQLAQGLSATQSGAALMPGTIALAISFPVAGFLLGVVTPRQMLAAGMLVFGGCWLLLGIVGGQLSYVWFVMILMVSRVGHGFAQTPVNQASLAGLAGNALAQAASMQAYVRQLGGVFGIGAVAVFIDRRLQQLGLAMDVQVRIYGEAFLIVALVTLASVVAIVTLRDRRDRSVET